MGVRAARGSLQPAAAAALLVLAAVAAAAVLWLGVSRPFQRVSSGGCFGGLRVEAVSTGDGGLTVYVRNVGGCRVVVDRVYVEELGGRVVAVARVDNGSSVVVWGGDRWRLSSGGWVRDRGGLLLYDEFNTLDTSVWRVRSTSNSRGSVWASSGYLKVVVSSTNSVWASRGVSSRNPVALPQSYVVEAELWKRGRAYWRYAVCLYLAARNTSSNPYYDTPWLAFKLYYRSWTTYLQAVYRSSSGSLVYRDFYSWSGSVWPHAHVLAVVEPGKVRAYAWVGGRDTSPDIIAEYSMPTLTGRGVYVFLTVDNPTTYSDEGWFGYIKIYRSTAVALEGLEPGRVYRLVDSRGRVCRFTATGDSMVIDFLNPPPGCEALRDWLYEKGFPWRGRLEAGELREVEPGRALRVAVDLPAGLQPGVYRVKVCSATGYCAQTLVRLS